VSSLADVEFRRASIADAEGLTRLMGQPEVLRNTLQLPMPNAEIWRKRLETQVVDPLQIHIVAFHGVELIGSAGLHPVTGSLRTRHVASLGMCVAPAWWGRGVGTELMRRLLDWADHWAGLLRIELGVFSDNARAIALYRKFGFELEGTQRAWALREGVFTDSLMMARLHPNPPRLPASGTPA
jgi:L-phenylalanine/L-methionine N-acetyltransferase